MHPSVLPSRRRAFPEVLLWLVPAAVLLALAGCTPSGTFQLPDEMVESCPAPEGAPDELRVVSYNIHGGVSSSLEDIARVLEGFDADVIALQEVDRGVERSGFEDQDRVLAERLGYQSAYAAARERGDGDFGIAILSRLPFTAARRVDLEAPFSSQPRVAIDASVCLGGQEVRVVAVHADVLPWATQATARDLADLVGDSMGRGVIVAGDLNVTPDSDQIRVLEEVGLVDVVGRADPAGVTFTGFGPRRLDYILVDGPLARRTDGAGIDPVQTSDHLPIWSTFGLQPMEAFVQELSAPDGTFTRSAEAVPATGTGTGAAPLTAGAAAAP